MTRSILLLSGFEPGKDVIKEIETAMPNSKVIWAKKWEDATEIIPEAEIVLGAQFLPSDQLARAKELKWIHSTSIGVDGALFDQIESQKIILTNSRGDANINVSEQVFSLIFAYTRGLSISIKNQLAHKWEHNWITTIKSSTIGIIGLGNIGREIARKAKVFGAKVIAVDPHATECADVDAIYNPDELDKLLTKSDYIIIAAALTDNTYHLLSTEAFNKMKETAYVINIGRGSIIDEEALIKALQQGKIGGAGLDVFEKEPLPQDSLLWSMDNVIIFPHMAGASDKNILKERTRSFIRNIPKYLRGEKMTDIEVDLKKGY